MITDERFAHQLTQHHGLQTELQVTRNLFERVPDVSVILKQFRMCRVFEVKKIGARKHFQAQDDESPRPLRAHFSGERAARMLAMAASLSRSLSSAALRDRLRGNDSCV